MKKAKAHSFGIIPVLLTDEPELLLICHHAGHWGFPKGHPHKGETHLESACREFEEETGVGHYRIIEGIQFVERYSFENKGQLIKKKVTYFLGEVFHDDVSCQETEIADHRWVGLKEARELIEFEAGQALLNDIEEQLREIVR